MRALRALCDANGVMLIADEVQTGFARTGKLFAMEHYDVQTDLITIAKSLAGGFPLSAVTGRAEIMDRVEPGGLGGTYGGSPIGCAAALAVLDVIDEEGLCARAEQLGGRAKARLQDLRRRNDIAPIDDIRGLGSMIAFDMVTERGGAAPDGAAAKRVTARALENGLILLACGVSGETIRLQKMTSSTPVWRGSKRRWERRSEDCDALRRQRANRQPVRTLHSGRSLFTLHPAAIPVDRDRLAERLNPSPIPPLNPVAV
jgi:4-aminobutyrate aminotransferase-like enzyme